MKAVYPGSFDPITYGHLDIITRASRIVDELVVGILVNNTKRPMFTMDERLEMLRETVKDLHNVEVKTFEGMTIDFARQNGAKVIIRGLRVISDYETEMQIAQTNHSVDPDIDTMFFTTSLEYAFLSSTVAREFAYFRGDVSKLVPPVVEEAFHTKLDH